MTINFKVRGRLGNAIFRYMACIIMCIHTNKEYSIHNTGNITVTDEMFYKLSQSLLKEEEINIKGDSFNLNEYYQHDTIYKKYKNEIINYINNHPDHIVITDGINAGDGNKEIFKIYDIVNTPMVFNKNYKNVLHIRLEDYVQHNLFINVERIINLLNQNIITDNICIVCKKPTTEFENNYIKQIKDFLITKNINVITEHNDILTDYYIMKEAEILICSKSTLSWCAAFFSNKIKQCYCPDYNIQPGIMTCKQPIDNTIIY
jgi:hypothetical protein